MSQTHHHEASHRHIQSTGGGVQVGTCNCGQLVWRPIADGVSPADNRNPWTLRDSEPLVTLADIDAAHAEARGLNTRKIERKCTRCQDTNGVPTGIVFGGECFLCRGAGTYVREVVDPATKAVMRDRAEAVTILRAATANLPKRDRLDIGDARIHLEEVAPERHLQLVGSLLAGRVDEVIVSLRQYATEASIR